MGVPDYFKHLSVSNVNGFISWRSKWYLERIAGFKSVMGPEAHRGSAVEHGVAHGLIQHAPPADCIALALHDYDELCADLDIDHTATIRDGIPALTTALLEHLKPYGKVVSTQRECRGEFSQLPGVNWIGFIDFEFESGLIVDVKTKKQTPSELPSDWGRQGAFYHNRLGMPVKFVCGIPLKGGPRIVTFDITDENGPQYLDQLLEGARAMDRILSLPKDSLADVFTPSPDDWFLKDEMTFNAAKEIWPILARKAA